MVASRQDIKAVLHGFLFRGAGGKGPFAQRDNCGMTHIADDAFAVNTTRNDDDRLLEFLLPHSEKMPPPTKQGKPHVIVLHRIHRPLCPERLLCSCRLNKPGSYQQAHHGDRRAPNQGGGRLSPAVGCAGRNESIRCHRTVRRSFASSTEQHRTRTDVPRSLTLLAARRGADPRAGANIDFVLFGLADRSLDKFLRVGVIVAGFERPPRQPALCPLRSRPTRASRAEIDDASADPPVNQQKRCPQQQQM